MSWGYKEVWILGSHLERPNGMVLEHRFNAERKLGRELLPNEVVHHIDDNRKNNVPSNLMVFRSQADHTRFHNMMRFHNTTIAVLLENGAYRCSVADCPDLVPLIKPCPRCGEDTWGKHCETCSRFLRRKVEWPTRDELRNLLLCYPFTKIGEICGVSDNNVRRWARHYGLPDNRSDVIKMRWDCSSNG